MAGHNKWSKVKHIKGAADAKKGKLFTKIMKEVTVSARLGGGDPDGNPRLRAAISAARIASMPKDNVERAVKKGTGELQDGTTIEEATYEGYGPGGVAILVETTTDNKNRTVSELRNIFKSSGGNLGENGSVAWMFDRIGQLIFDGEKHTEDTVMEIALEAGAEDVSASDGVVEVRTEVTNVYRVKDSFDKVGIHPNSAGLSYIAKTTLAIEDKDIAQKLIKLLNSIEEHEDVQKVHANFEMGDKLLREASAS